MSKLSSGSSQPIIERLTALGTILTRYSYILFIAFVLSLYGFVLFRAETLRSAEPTDDAVSSQVKAANVPHIDENIIKQLQTLQDNSVSVQTLFDQARNTPFEQSSN